MGLHSGRNGDDTLGIKTVIFIESALDESPSSFVANVILACGEGHFEDALGYVNTIWMFGFYSQTMDLSYISGVWRRVVPRRYQEVN
jgi:hypothetical protein